MYTFGIAGDEASGTGRKRTPSEPSRTAALSEYALMVWSGVTLCVLRIIAKSDCGCTLPSMVHVALKILWRQCSELT